VVLAQFAPNRGEDRFEDLTKSMTRRKRKHRVSFLPIACSNFFVKRGKIESPNIYVSGYLR